jgi:ornithine--oxo-acid transaminase
MSQTIADLISTESRLGAHNYQPLDVIIARGEGVYLWDVDGNRYLDCLSAYSAVNQGHCHPKILAAMVEQAQKLTLTSRAFRNDQLALFYQDMETLTGAHKILPMNSGAEAVETAIKAVRKWGYEVKGVPENAAEIIVCAGNFHGRTLGIVGFSTDPAARGGFGPFAPGFKIIPFGDAEALEAAITLNTVAFLVEPIQGEAGVIIPPAGYLADVARLCRSYGAFLVLDEIQTGLGRLGWWWGAQRDGITPDVLLAGKALGGGVLPVSAAVATAEAFAPFDRDPFVHTSTFSGSPLGMAAAVAAITVLREQGLVERARRLGRLLLGAIEAILRDALGDAVGEVRGLGLLIGIEFTEDGLAGELLLELMATGVIANHSLNAANVLRLTPPAVLTDQDVDFLLAAVESAARTVRGVR